ncbi:MAG: glycerate kinase, partial [Rhodoferax sp.]|nr:glycerate kinase [Rhodoferax sp.]
MPAIHTIPRPDLEPRAFLQYLYNAAVTRALPLHNTAAWLPLPPAPATGGRTIVLGAGKAAGAMAQSVEAHWP